MLCANLPGVKVKLIWLNAPDVIGLHDEALADSGGFGGLRDRPLLESAVARPQNRATYEHCSLFDLAATYCVGIAKNHAFIDGNERAGYQAAAVFLHLNGWLATPPEVEIVEMMVRVAESDAGEDEIAAWFERNSSRLQKQNSSRLQKRRGEV